MRNKYLISTFVIIFISFIILLFLSILGVKTKSLNGLINERIKNINSNINLEISDVFLKLNIFEGILELNTKNPVLKLDDQQLDLSNINLKLDLLDYLTTENNIPKIQLKTKKIPLKNLVNFYNKYDFDLKRFIVFNQIKEGKIILEIEIYPGKETIDKTKFKVSGSIFDANINVVNKLVFENVNLDFEIENTNSILSNLNFKFKDNNFFSDRINILGQNFGYEIKGDIKSKDSIIYVNDISSFTNLNLSFLQNKIFFSNIESEFLFKINENYKIKNIDISSSFDFDQLNFSDKFKSPINFKSGKILAKYNGEDLKVNIDSNYKFIKDKYNNKQSTDKINLTIFKKKNQDFEIEVLFKNTKNIINSSEFSNFLKLNNNFILEDQKLIISTDNKINFSTDNELKIENLKINSKIFIDKALIKLKSKRFEKYFKGEDNKIKFLNNEINIDYDKKKLITISGTYLFQKKINKYKLFLDQAKKYTLFNIDLGLSGFEFNSLELDYKKTKNSNSQIKLKGIYNKNKGINFKNINFFDNDNTFSINNLNISKDDKILDLEKIRLNYLTEKNNKVDINISRKGKNYIISGSYFDGTYFIDNLIKGSQSSSNFKLFKNLNSKIIIDLKKLNIDQNSYLSDVKGNLKIDNNKIVSSAIIAKVNGKDDFNLNIKTSQKKERVTNIFINNPEAFIKKYKFVKGFSEGSLSYDNIKKGNVSTSKLKIYDFKVKEVPILAKILTLASLQGIADILTGEGIRFDEFDMDYKTIKNKTEIQEMYAIGSAISILMDGYIVKDEVTSLRGTLVPATTINKSIAKIPLLGKILVGKKVGEGVFGVSFKIKGKPKNLKTSVNPVKTLTPRFITRTLEKIKN